MTRTLTANASVFAILDAVATALFLIRLLPLRVINDRITQDSSRSPLTSLQTAQVTQIDIYARAYLTLKTLA